MDLPIPRHAQFAFAAVFFVFIWCVGLRAQENYEIQVYPSETMAPGVLLTELHSNYTVEGSTSTQYGMLPTQGQEHETVEFTQGITNWSEVGFYIFTEEHVGTGFQWVGDHIRPRVGYDVTKVVNAGFAYYGALGPITGFDPLQHQQQQIFAVTDLNFSPKWEFNFGVGVGLTSGTDLAGENDHWTKGHDEVERTL